MPHLMVKRIITRESKILSNLGIWTKRGPIRRPNTTSDSRKATRVEPVKNRQSNSCAGLKLCAVVPMVKIQYSMYIVDHIVHNHPNSLSPVIVGAIHRTVAIDDNPWCNTSINLIIIKLDKKAKKHGLLEIPSCPIHPLIAFGATSV